MPPISRAADVILIVDDVPENLAVLHDALDETGYTVLIATDGESALLRARQSMPDVVLLDASMPGMDGFEVCRRLKNDHVTQHIPVIFMTGLPEAEHVVAGFEAGGTDYVTKPIRPTEALARIASHLQNSRVMTQARSALDAYGQATMAITLHNGSIIWQTPLARQWLGAYFEIEREQAPPQLLAWVSTAMTAKKEGRESLPLVVTKSTNRLSFFLLDLSSDPLNDNECLILLREDSDGALIQALMLSFKLTMRESEVLYWIIKGKTNRDIGDILGSSPRTVNKHLEHVFFKLGVETRTAAASMAMNKVRSIRSG